MCDCPVACKGSNYDATISYASVSQLIKDSSRNETENSPYDFKRKLARVSFYMLYLYYIISIIHVNIYRRARAPMHIVWLIER